MGKKGTKKTREKGKIRLSNYFQEFKKGDTVAVVREVSLQPGFPSIIQGRTGIVDGKRGKSYEVKINDNKKEKRYFIEPIHLKKIKTHKLEAQTA
ncbi:MAG: 50S ribosomal protein L21e [Candidatus Pacearchaeota archaeon]